MRMSLSMSDEEHRILKEKAKALGLSLGRYLRISGMIFQMKNEWKPTDRKERRAWSLHALHHQQAHLPVKRIGVR